MGKLVKRDDIIEEFLKAVFEGEGLHPEDAAIKIGQPYELFLGLRDSDTRVAAAWLNAEKKKKGKYKYPKTPLEIKYRLASVMWPELEPLIMRMIRRIPDDEKGDKMVVFLLKNKIISETLPKESFGKQEVTHREEDPYKGMSDEDLFKIAEKKLGALADLKSQAEQASLVRERLARARIIDVEYKRGDPPAA